MADDPLGVTLRVKELWDQVEAVARPPISQRKFAAKCKLDPQQFNQWVNGKSVPSLSSIMEIAKVFGVPWQWLLIGNDGMKALKKWDDAKRPQADVRELARDDSPPGRRIAARPPSKPPEPKGSPPKPTSVAPV